MRYYAVIHLHRPDGAKQTKWLRQTLAELQRQIPGTVRIHRSYLVHPARVLEVRGNAKKREVVLEGADQPLPASQRVDLAALGTGR